MIRLILIILLSINLYSNSQMPEFLIDKDQVLPANEAFNFKAAINDETILLSWEIKKGYYIYLKSIKIEDNFKELDYEVLESQESIHMDEFFGESKIYRNKTLVKLNRSSELNPNNILIKYQGCADAGFCYPVQIHKIL